MAATYLRIWAPGIATAVLVLSSSSLATAIAATLFGLSAWSWTWWPRDAAVRRRSDFDRAAFGSRCDPARMTDEMHQLLANQLTIRASADLDPRPTDDVVRSGARNADEALRAYGLLRLTDARSPRPRESLHIFDGAERRITAFRRLRRRGGPYRDRSASDTLELWATVLASVQVSATQRRTGPLGSHEAVPAPAVVLPRLVRKPWIWFAVLAVSTVGAGVALSRSSTPHPPPQEAPPGHRLPICPGWRRVS